MSPLLHSVPVENAAGVNLDEPMQTLGTSTRNENLAFPHKWVSESHDHPHLFLCHFTQEKTRTTDTAKKKRNSSSGLIHAQLMTYWPSNPSKDNNKQT